MQRKTSRDRKTTVPLRVLKLRNSLKQFLVESVTWDTSADALSKVGGGSKMASKKQVLLKVVILGDSG